MLKMTLLGIALAALALPAGAAADKEFMTKAAQGGQAEVALGKLATQHGSSTAVNGFGRHMVTDHSKANVKLMGVAAKEHVALPKTMGPDEKELMTKLAKLSGKAFDRAYIAAMVEDHEKDIAEFSEEASTGKDPAVKSFAARTLPTLKMHLQMAQSIAAKQGK